MGALTGQTIASSYEQLLHVDRDGGGNSTTHVSIKDGDNGTTFGFTIATDALMMTSTNRLEFGDTGTYIHQSADGVLDLVSDTELELNAITIDINGAVDISGALQVDGAITSSTGATVTTADNTDTLSLISTDADANSGSNLRLYRNSASPAGNDLLGNIQWEGRNNNSQDVVYAEMRAQIETTTDGSEDANFKWSTMKAGTSRDRLSINANATVFNDDSQDVDFRVESDGNANMLFVDGGNNRVGIGTASPTSIFDVQASSGASLLYEDAGEGLLSLINSSGTALIRFDARNAEHNYINNGGKFGIGNSSPAGALNISGAGVNANVYIDAHSADADGGNLIFRKSRNATIGNLSDEPNSADALGSIYFQGADSDSWETGAVIRANADENWGSSALGTALTFHTVDNTTTTLDERMRIDHNGRVGIGTTSPDYTLDVAGNMGIDERIFHCDTLTIISCTISHMYM